MTKLVLAEVSDLRISNGRMQPFFIWFNFLNFVTVSVLCLLLLKIHKNFLLLYEWFRKWFFVGNVSKYPKILVLGPKTKIIQEVVNQLSRTFQSEVVECKDMNDNSLPLLKPKKKLKKSQIILSNIPISSKEVVTEFNSYIEKIFGVIDILIVSQNEEPLENKSTHCVFDHFNRQLMSQFWTVMTFLPGMLRRNRGHILSVALEKSSLTNTGVMRSIHEELLQLDTNVKLTLVESNLIFDNCYYLPSLSSDILARLIVRSMWTCSSVVKVPSIPSYIIMIPIEMVRCMMRPILKVVNFASNEFHARLRAMDP